LFVLTAACAPTRAPDNAPLPQWSYVPAAPAEAEEYFRVSPEAADRLGCTASPSSPVCEVAQPNAEEDSAFAAEGARLQNHEHPRCRELGVAIDEHRSSVMMYRKAMVRISNGQRYYGVGHTFEIGNAWAVRVARRIDDMNDRTLDEKLRTLRHETSHTIGASERGGMGWTAEDYASRCG
jgi:hypothetical protein